MPVTQDPSTWELKKDGHSLPPEPTPSADTAKPPQPQDRAGVIKVSSGALRTIKAFSQYALADRRYHGTVRDNPKSYRKFARSENQNLRDHVSLKHRYKLPSRSYVPKTVVLQDQPAINVFDMTRPYLASAKDDQQPTPSLTIEEGIPESWERPARVARLHSLQTERHQWHKQVSKSLDATVPYRDHVVDIKKHKKAIATKGIATARGQAYADLLKQGAQYAGTPAPAIQPVAVP